MEYKDIVKILFLPENESLIPDGVAYSEAICEKKDGILVDSFFLYTIKEMRSEAVGPLAKISVDASTGRIVDYCEYENPQEFSLENRYDSATILDALDNYEALYPKLRDAYCRKEQDANTRELLLQIIKDINIFANDEMLSIYNQLFTETFQFIISHSE